MDLVNNLLKYINSNNSKIIKQLVDLITDNKINTLEELKHHEENKFKTNNKFMNKEEKINYCLSIIKYSSYDYELLDYDEIQLYKNYKNGIVTNDDLNIKILNLIKIFNLTNRDNYFPYETYEFIIDKKL